MKNLSTDQTKWKSSNSHFVEYLDFLLQLENEHENSDSATAFCNSGLF